MPRAQGSGLARRIRSAFFSAVPNHPVSSGVRLARGSGGSEAPFEKLDQVYSSIDQSNLSKEPSHDTATSTHDRRHAITQLRHHHATQLHPLCADFAKHFNRSPQDLDLEAVRQYQLYLTQERKLSPQSLNTFVSAVQFLYLVTLEMPWDKHDFPRARLDQKLPVVLAPDEVQCFQGAIA